MSDWLDLSAHNHRLYVLEHLVNDKIEYLLCLAGVKRSDVKGIVTQDEARARRLGFEFLPRTGLWIRRNYKVNVKEFAREFPGASKVSMSRDKIFRRVGGPRNVMADPNTAGNAVPADQNDIVIGNAERVALNQRRFLGVNYLGHRVYEGVNGRYAVVDDRTTIHEGPGSGMGPAVFMRAPDTSALALCCDGFITYNQLQTVHPGDLRAFVAAVSNLQPEDAAITDLLPSFKTAIRAAIVRRLSHDIEVIDRETFDHCLSQAEKMVAVDIGLPLHIGVVAQMLAGVNDAPEGILVATDPAGSVLSAIPRNSRVQIVAERTTDADRAKSVAATRAYDTRPLAATHTAARAAISATAGRPENEFRPAAVMPNDGWPIDLVTTRADHRAAIEILHHRSPNGVSVHILEADDDGHKAADTIAEIAKLYEIEAILSLDAPLFNQHPGQPGQTMFVVGARRPQPVQNPVIPEIKVVADAEGLWNTSVEILVNRAANDDVVDQLAVPGGRKSSVLENEFQSPYISASQSGEPITAVPRYLSGATNEALRDLVHRRGDVDAWVAQELGWTLERLHAVAAPEQIDAVAMAIDSHLRGYGFLLGDMTGVGKGRTLALLAVYAVNHDIPILFLTERANLMKDFMRDIYDIGAEDILKPYIMNSQVKIRHDKEIVLTGASVAQNRALTASGAFPEGCNAVMATYSQFNRPESAKTAWLRAVAPGAMVISDESHNAAGDSNIYETMSEVMNKAAISIFSSATWAKEVKNLGYYARLFPQEFRNRGSEIGEIISRGGQPMQEIMSAMLVRMGVYLRREHDASKLELAYLTDEKYVARNRDLLNRFAPVLQAMAYLSGDIDDISARLRRQQKDMLRQAKGSLEEEGYSRARGRRRGDIDVAVKSANFGSRLFNIARLFAVATKVDAAVDKAIADLKKGEKPVILAESTMEAVLRDLANEADLYPDMGLTKNPDPVTGYRYPDFKILLYRTLDRIVGLTDKKRREIALLAAGGQQGQTFEEALENSDIASEIAETLEDGDVEEVLQDALDPEDVPDEILFIDPNLELLDNETVRESYQMIRKMIQDLPDLPLSPFDVIRDRLEHAGFTVGEISGRTIRWDDRAHADAGWHPDKLVNFIRRPVNDLIDEFNSGETDVVILGKPGTTGASLHASATFADQNRRQMIVLQPPLDVVAFMQAIGRVNRRGQVSVPGISVLSNGTPAENYIESMHNRKMRSLSANTTSNRDNAAISDDIPDILNKVGAEVCKELLQTDRGFARALAIRDVHNLDGDTAAYLVMSRLCLLSADEQEARFDDILREYRLKLEEYEARGENPLRAAEIKGQYRLTGKSLFQGVPGKPGAIYVLEFEGEVEIRPLRPATVLHHVADGQEKTGDICSVAWRHLDLNRSHMIRPLLPMHEDPETADLRHYYEASRLAADIDFMKGALAVLEPGSSVVWHEALTNGLRGGIVTRILPPARVEHYHIPAKWILEIAMPGNDHPVRYKLSHLRGMNDFRINPGLHGERGDEILKEFEYALGGTIVQRPKMLVGDELAGAMEAVLISMNQKAGVVASITDEWGAKHRGVHLDQKFDLSKIPVAVTDPGIIADFIQNRSNSRQRLSSDSTGTLKDESDVFEIWREDEETAFFRVPTVLGKHGNLLSKEPLKALMQRYANRPAPNADGEQKEVKRRNQRIFQFPIEQVGDVIRAMIEGGVSIYAKGTEREWINDRMQERDMEMRRAMGDQEPEEEEVQQQVASVRIGRKAA